MENIFYNFVYNAIKLKKIKEDMTWWQKINPFYKKKIKAILNNLYGYLDIIQDCKLSRLILLDFQKIYIMNQDTVKYDNISLCNFSNSNIKCIFYPMTFKTNDDGILDTVTINITGDTVNIHSDTFYNLVFVNEMKTDDNIAQSIKNTICDYLEEYLV